MGQTKLSVIEGGIAVLSVVRPEALNALSKDIVDEIDAQIETVRRDADIRVLILYSEGNFAAGADIKVMAGCDEEQARAFIFSPTYDKISALSIPVIAAIEGYALGGGMELALTADIRIAGESAKMGFPEITLGIMPGAGGTVRLPHIVGEPKAKELIFTGAIIAADEAAAIGLVNRTVPDGEVFAEAEALAAKLAKRAPIAMAAAKTAIHFSKDNAVAESIAAEAGAWAKLFNSEDQKEGMQAFLEKRKPVFRNK
ncbi:MAG: enoyl-CoA hydratase/isomerase family protein [Clostridiales Family XIII bacterium]|jgi:enoyl-CoA hydratase/carnithine racemase|nr:enoyl-CoA hydratase/isomerase family protein [Clostridiales Family XIII bacterium]